MKHFAVRIAAVLLVGGSGTEPVGSEHTPQVKSATSSSESVAVSSSVPVWREVGLKQGAGAVGSGDKHSEITSHFVSVTVFSDGI